PELKSGPKLKRELQSESEFEFKSEGLDVESESKPHLASSPIEKMDIEPVDYSTENVSLEFTATDEESLLEIIPTEKENEPPFQINEEQSSLREKPEEDNLLEFESGLHHLLTEKSTTKEDNVQEQISDEDHGLDFTPSMPAEVGQIQKDDESKKLSKLKSQKALDTLLALAKTYIGMEDIESALNSLNEVMEHGSKSQKEEAQRLIDEIHGKS
ncbi:TPA: FimV/HubP family polar landmark protein, partial [Legionella anisa]